MRTSIELATSQQADTDFGPQGGDPRRLADGIRLDLSTCVNRYGPPPAALAVLATIAPRDLQLHPYAGAARVEQAYGSLLGVDPAELVAGRGTTEFIWALSRQMPRSSVLVPLPAYTDYLRAFPGRGFAGSRPSAVHSLRQLNEAMGRSGLVILSNPHNPSGACLDPDGLLAVAARNRHCVLVVDESYVDFVPDPEAATVIRPGVYVPNVVALRSPSKFYGIAATRAGVVWCPDRARLDDLLGDRETWPVSGLDAAIAVASLEGRAWASRARRQLVEDGLWLAERLRAAGLDPIEHAVAVHYRCVLTADPNGLARRFAAHGLGVRPLGAAHGVEPGAVRILAPRRDERAFVAKAIAAVGGAGILEACG